MLTEPTAEVADTQPRELALDDAGDAALVLLALYGVRTRRDLTPDERDAVARLVERTERLLFLVDDAASADGELPAHAPAGAAS